MHTQATWGRAAHPLRVESDTTDDFEPSGRGLIARKDVTQGEPLIQINSKCVMPREAWRGVRGEEGEGRGGGTRKNWRDGRPGMAAEEKETLDQRQTRGQERICGRGGLAVSCEAEMQSVTREILAGSRGCTCACVCICMSKTGQARARAHTSTVTRTHTG
eukprot:4850864-Pleurochrysis_carterae.AAC.1